VTDRPLTIDDAARLLSEALNAELPRVTGAGYRVAGLIRVWREGDDGEELAGVVVNPTPTPPPPASAPSGNACKDCGGPLVQSGTCETCHNCGSTTGCG
jgi:hypothetical protein